MIDTTFEYEYKVVVHEGMDAAWLEGELNKLGKEGYFITASDRGTLVLSRSKKVKYAPMLP